MTIYYLKISCFLVNFCFKYFSTQFFWLNNCNLQDFIYAMESKELNLNTFASEWFLFEEKQVNPFALKMHQI